MNQATTLEWGDALLLGHDPMDELHEEFVDLARGLQAATDIQLPAALQAMERHLQQHFAEENQWMRETAFPPRDCHIDEHAAVLKSVHEVQALLAQGNVAICRELVKALVEWFPGHATHLDSALAHWLSKRRFGGKPIVLRRGTQHSG
jgi:hemerythrin-like metal-binding protein